MKKIALLVLLLVAAALVAIVVRDRAEPSEVERSIRKNNVFLVFRKEDVRKIEIQGPEGAFTILRATDGSARVLSPVEDAADASRVDRLLGVLEFAAVSRTVGAAHPGMNAPIVRVTMEMGSRTLRFAMGDEAPGKAGARYFQIEGEKVIVVDKALAEALLAKADAYRERALTSIRVQEIESVSLGAPGGVRVKILAKGEGRFALDNGFTASREAMDHVFTAFAEMSADRFLDAPALDAAERSATLEVEVSEKGGRLTRFVVAGACEGAPDRVVLARTLPTRKAMCVAKRSVEAFSLPADAWMERAPFTLRFDEMEEIRIRAPAAERTFEAVRKGGGWNVRIPFEEELTPAAAEIVNAHALRLAALRGLRIDHGSPPGVVVAEATVRGHERTEKVQLFGTTAEWKLFRESDGAIITIQEGERELFLPDEILRRLRPSDAPRQAP